MTNRKLYALTDDAVMRLEAYARATASVASNYAADALIPLDRDAAVERMADAMIEASPDGPLITEGEREWYLGDARVAFDTLLQGEG